MAIDVLFLVSLENISIDAVVSSGLKEDITRIKLVLAYPVIGDR